MISEHFKWDAAAAADDNENDKSKHLCKNY